MMQPVLAKQYCFKVNAHVSQSGVWLLHIATPVSYSQSVLFEG